MNGMNSCEIIVKLAKEARTLEILAMLKDCKDLEEAEQKIKALLKN